MDLIKIGKYITSKRKELGMTQRQVAENLRMSDKSVSKWERGICLPDVSVYSELCRILGISINEFLAGEDISQENMVKRSEENIIGVVTDSKRKQTHLVKIVSVLLVILFVTLSIIGTMIYQSYKPQNTILPIDKESVEMKTAELLSGSDGAFIYKYTTTDKYSSLKIYVTEYQSGVLMNRGNFEFEYDEIGSPANGNICIIPDFNNFIVKLIVSSESSKYSTELPILEDVQGREYYGRSATEIQEAIDIRYDEEQGLAALIYDDNEMRVFDFQNILDGETDAFAMDDYVYYFSFEFCKEE